MTREEHLDLLKRAIAITRYDPGTPGKIGMKV
jgi:hypothetical protein